MKMGAPKTITEELMNKIYQMYDSGMINEITLQSIVNKAKPLACIEPVHYEYIMGAVACLRKDETSMRKCYNRVLTNHPDIPESHYNFALSLYKINKYLEALHQVNIALNLQPDYEPAQNLKKNIEDHIEKQMWDGIENDTEESLLSFCANTTMALEKNDSCEVQ
ncbi:hypothetical protein Dthio_PD2890 [Desulfonatronospira thiodismutans ASO3-1]|uniref:Uncharacterized protein n=1 Tax=Desulfonatronospira thiodismutans ASO3-1 TaxID=555779 RepID=D6SLA9_9BACT|nr:hypothetical protein [Desulfonatronospira thiodismutans]EFI35470.1 hypothetical protein Dthio_PD2890 [Desulfonatronospira thiodismutans ASO3-1]